MGGVVSSRVRPSTMSNGTAAGILRKTKWKLEWKVSRKTESKAISIRKKRKHHIFRMIQSKNTNIITIRSQIFSDSHQLATRVWARYVIINLIQMTLLNFIV